MTTASNRFALCLAVGLLGVTTIACDADDQTASSTDASTTTEDSPPRSTASTTVDVPADPIQDLLDTWTSQGPGGVTAAIADDGEPVALYASGVATSDGAAIEVDDELRVGSISKSFVAVMLLQLVDEGVLELDEPVTRYVSWIELADGVTVRQLLGHASGIPEYTDEGFSQEILADLERTWTPPEVIEFVSDRPADFVPGERRAYSNTNYIIAGLLLEEITGTSLADNLRSRIVEPLGLTGTYFAPEDGREPIPGFSPSLAGGDTTTAPYRAIETAAGAAGALVSTASDLADFISALADGRLLSPDTFEAMTRDLASEQFGLGIFPSELPSGGGIGNGGAIPGFAAFMGIDPQVGDLFVILTNDDNRSIDDLATELTATLTTSPTTNPTSASTPVDGAAATEAPDLILAGRRGEVVDVAQQATLPREEVQAVLDAVDLPGLGVARYGMAIWRVTYSTIDVDGEPTIASGTVIVPDGASGPRPVVSDQHGTETERLTATSTPQEHESFLAGILFATQGYLVVAADYLGLGVAPGLHPYLHAASEASASVDMLSAARAAAPLMQTELGEQLFLSGYSQGGHVTMALHRELEAHDHGFTVTAAAAMAGPYDLDTVSLPTALAEPAAATSLYLAYAIVGLNQVYGFVDDLSEAFQTPYDDLVVELFDGTHSTEDIARQLPGEPADLLQPEFLQQLHDGSGGFVDALRANNVYDWRPAAPVMIIHGGADHDVPFGNAEVATRRMLELGADVELVNVGDDLDHATAVEPSYLAAKSRFDWLAAGL